MIAPLILQPAQPDAFGRVTAWRRAAYGVTTDQGADLCEWFGFRPGEARLVVALYRAPGGLTRPALAGAADLSFNSVAIYVRGAREALGPDTITLTEGVYRLTQAGRAEVERATAEVGLERLRAELAA